MYFPYFGVTIPWNDARPATRPGDDPPAAVTRAHGDSGVVTAKKSRVVSYQFVATFITMATATAGLKSPALLGIERRPALG